MVNVLCSDNQIQLQVQHHSDLTMLKEREQAFHRLEVRMNTIKIPGNIV